MTATDYALVIGDKNYSSWSLRPWLLMRALSIPFREINVELRAPGRRARILEHSPSGKVPALKAGDLVVWDSLAIVEYLAGAHPDRPVWPQDAEARAVARSVSAEMHSGFSALREEMPMDFVTVAPANGISEPVARDIRRIVEIWRMARGQYGIGGDFLFGTFSAADAIYAPVASRFRTYVGDLAPYGDDGTSAAYVKTIFAMAEVAEWAEGARAELTARAAS